MIQHRLQAQITDKKEVTPEAPISFPGYFGQLPATFREECSRMPKPGLGRGDAGQRLRPLPARRLAGVAAGPSPWGGASGAAPLGTIRKRTIRSPTSIAPCATGRGWWRV